jgi:preprotein translocase subunit SecG
MESNWCLMIGFFEKFQWWLVIVLVVIVIVLLVVRSRQRG